MTTDRKPRASRKSGTPTGDELDAAILRFLRATPNRAVDLAPLAGDLGVDPVTLIAREGGKPKDVPVAFQPAKRRVRAQDEAARLPRAEVYGVKR